MTTPNDPILAVDDDPAVLHGLRDILAGDYRMVFARTGGDALAAAAKHSPGLILLASSLSDMDGRAVCRALSETPLVKTPAILLMTRATDWHVGDWPEGATDYLPMPLNPVIIRARVSAYMALASAQDRSRAASKCVHDINNVLSIISANLQLIRQNPSAENLHKGIEASLKAGLRCADIVGRLRDTAK